VKALASADCERQAGYNLMLARWKRTRAPDWDHRAEHASLSQPLSQINTVCGEFSIPIKLLDLNQSHRHSRLESIAGGISLSLAEWNSR
jgi:hypothetical protein